MIQNTHTHAPKQSLYRKQLTHYGVHEYEASKARGQTDYVRTVELLICKVNLAVASVLALLYSVFLWVPPLVFRYPELKATEVKALKLKMLLL